MVAGEGRNKTVREKLPSKDYPALPKQRRRGGSIPGGFICPLQSSHCASSHMVQSSGSSMMDSPGECVMMDI